MALYLYKATDQSGKIVEGSLEAAEEKGVVEKLHDLSLIPIRVQLPKEVQAVSLDISLDFLFGRVTSRDVLIFTQELNTLVNAGLSLDRSLEIMVELTENKKFKEVIQNVLKEVEGGSSLAEAFSKHPKIFSRLYTNMIRAGEAGGVVDLILKRLAEYLENARETRDFIISALIYPIILTLVGAVMIVVMLVWVIPKFAIIFEDLGQTLPLPTRVLLAVSHGIISYWWLFLALFIGGAIGFKRAINTEEGRIKWDKIKFRIGLIRQFIKKTEVARFSRTLGTLIRSGVPILEALNVVKETMGNMVFVHAIADVRNKMKEGENISKPLEESGVFPPLSIYMITVGEETGKLNEMLLKVADTYEKEVKNSIKRMISLLEPLLILIMGIGVGFIVFSMLMAIFSVNEIAF
ncbi:MAG: type II secretion system F family protein [Proteobacteria bacterium]|nr:type II secretion system F family protein [Pseudomonadota bacterium]